MGHRKWSQEKGCGLFSAEVNEHNALYDAWVVERDRADELLKDRNLIQHKLDEARKRIAELESPLRVPFSDDVIERMARGARRAWAGCEGWENMSNVVHQQWRNTIRAALAAGGLEPCADPADVALRPADDAWKTPLEMKQIFGKARAYTLENTAVIQYEDTYIYLSPADAARMAAWLSSYAAAHGVPSDTPIIADLHKQLEAARREVDEVRRHISVTMSREHQARKEAQEAKRQADEYLRMYKNEEKNAQHWKAKVEAVTAEDLRSGYEKHRRENAQLHDEYMMWEEYAMDYLAAHAFSDVPQPSSNAGQFDADEVEALAQDVDEFKATPFRDPTESELESPLFESIWKTIKAWDINVPGYGRTGAQGNHVAAIMDAIAHIRKRPEDREYLAVDDLPTRSEMEREYRLIRDVHSGNYNNALVALHDWIAPRLPEHMRKRPEGLPTREQMAQIIYNAGWCKSYVWDDNDGGSERNQIYAEADAILAALAPFLRDPVGKPELDVTAGDIYTAWCKSSDRSHEGRWQAVLDLCRSRIRPVYECKECANWKAHAAAIEDSSFDMIKRINLARAALDGE